MENSIEVRNLWKSFGDVKAVQGISFVVHKGELFAFLGLNGAGKSTTINMITGALRKDEGTILINGLNIDANIDNIRSQVGIVYQSGVLDRFLTVRENLRYKEGLYGYTGTKFEDRLKEVVEELDLEPILNRTLGKLSGGQKRRVDIARALFHRPSILILDEPTTGLDPQTRKTVWKVIDKEREEKGLTVFLTTHYMEEAAEAHYVVILDHGKIVANGSPIELKEKYSHDFLYFYYFGDKQKEMVKLESLECKEEEDRMKIRIENSSKARELLLKYPDAFTDFEVIKGKMDDVFLAVTGTEITKGEEKHA